MPMVISLGNSTRSVTSYCVDWSIRTVNVLKQLLCLELCFIIGGNTLQVLEKLICLYDNKKQLSDRIFQLRINCHTIRWRDIGREAIDIFWWLSSQIPLRFYYMYSMDRFTLSFLYFILFEVKYCLTSESTEKFLFIHFFKRCSKIIRW